MKRYLPTFLLVGLGLFFFFLIVLHSKTTNVSAATATHVVISEVQTTGVTAGDEFVELYNPTNLAVNLSGWRLSRKTSTGAQANLATTLSGTISAHGFFLIAPPSTYTGTATPDFLYSTGSRIANSNSVILFSDAGVTTVDLVGLGTAVASETATIGNPATGGSVERKANSSSIALTMAIGGLDEFGGNGEDTDNNNSDFVLRTVSHPQNSQSAIEPPPASPTPSVSPSVSPTESPTPSVSPTPTDTPTPTPSPSPSPTESPTPSPSPSPSPSPTVTATPTLSPTPSTTPIPTLTPTPGGGQIIVNTLHLVCTLNYKTIPFFNFHISIPVVKCMKI